MWLWLPLASPAEAVETWWSADWSTRARLRIDNAASTDDLRDFPLLVVLREGVNFEHAGAAAEGADLRFVDSTGKELYYEIERWDDRGTSTVWVRVPNVRRASDGEVLWLYYGNPEADAESDSEWTFRDHLGVWHLSEPNGTLDATGNNSATSRGAPTPQVAMVGWGRSMQNAGQGYVVSDTHALTVEDAITVSVWVWLSDWRVEDAALVTRESDWSLQRCGTNDRPAWVVNLDDGGGRREICGEDLLFDTWHQVVGVYDREDGGAVLYVDGEEVAASDEEDSLLQVDGAEMAIANDEAGDASPIAVFDEVRIADVARSASWIRADWRSVNDQLVTWCALGDEDPYPADPCAVADLDPSNEPGGTIPDGGPDGDTLPTDPRGPGSDIEVGGGAVPGCSCATGAPGGGAFAVLLGGLVLGRRRREVTAPG